MPSNTDSLPVALLRQALEVAFHAFECEWNTSDTFDEITCDCWVKDAKEFFKTLDALPEQTAMASFKPGILPGISRLDGNPCGECAHLSNYHSAGGKGLCTAASCGCFAFKV